MEYKIYSQNKELCLTPEDKLKKWAKIIQDKALSGETVLLYADTETTGFEYGNRGRGIYDPLMDRKKLQADSFNFGIPLKDLEDEAKSLSGKVDRMIEISFVACYKNKSGEIRPLKDDDGDLIFFHEMISPYRDMEIGPKGVMDKMPIIPHIIHRTSFDFLQGKEMHPFLNIQLPYEAPSTRKTMETFFDFFDYEDDRIFDNIVMLFHNANEFDVPFIDSEISKMGDDYANKTIRDYVKVYDTLAIIKTLLPNPVQKLVSFNQVDPIYGGDPLIKEVKNEYITGHHKNLDNLIRFARYVPNFDLGKAVKYQSETNQEHLVKIKNAMIKSHVKPTNELMEAMGRNIISNDFIDSLPVEFTSSNKSLIEDYKKFVSAVDGYKKNIDEVNESYPDIMKNLNGIKTKIDKSPDFKENIDMINSIGRDSHGAKVDSMLFMYAMTIIENSMYVSNKITYTIENKEPEPINPDVFKKLQEHLDFKKKANSSKLNNIASDLKRIVRKSGLEEDQNIKDVSPAKTKQLTMGL